MGTHFAWGLEKKKKRSLSRETLSSFLIHLPLHSGQVKVSFLYFLGAPAVLWRETPHGSCPHASFCTVLSFHVSRGKKITAKKISLKSLFNIPKATDEKKNLLNCFIFLRLYLCEDALMRRVSDEESTELQNERSDSRLFCPAELDASSCRSY